MNLNIGRLTLMAGTERLFTFEGTSDPNNKFTDWLKASVESRWPSLRQFCDACDIDSGQFSKRLARNDDFSYTLIIKMYKPLRDAGLLSLKDKGGRPMRWWEFVAFAGLAPAGVDMTDPKDGPPPTAYSVGPLTVDQQEIVDKIALTAAEALAAQNAKANTPR